MCRADTRQGSFRPKPKEARLLDQLEFFLYFFFDFRKINSEPKFSRNIHLAPNLTAAVGHGVGGGTNGRLTCEVGLDSCPCRAWRQES
jgi:hypothetical protein